MGHLSAWTMEGSVGVVAGLIRDSLSVATWEAYAGAWEE